MIVKTSVPGYVKDTDTGALINTNEEEFMQFMAFRAQQKENRILKQELSDIKQQVAAIIEKLGK